MSAKCCSKQNLINYADGTSLCQSCGAIFKDGETVSGSKIDPGVVDEIQATLSDVVGKVSELGQRIDDITGKVASLETRVLTIEGQEPGGQS